MALPKTMTDSLVRKLNEACSTFSSVCNGDCGNLGWCDVCWVSAGSDEGDVPEAGLTANHAEEVTR